MHCIPTLCVHAKRQSSGVVGHLSTIQDARNLVGNEGQQPPPGQRPPEPEPYYGWQYDQEDQGQVPQQSPVPPSWPPQSHQPPPPSPYGPPPASPAGYTPSAPQMSPVPPPQSPAPG